VLAQRAELVLACGLGVLHDLPIIVLPGAIFPASRDRSGNLPRARCRGWSQVLTFPMLVLAEMSYPRTMTLPRESMFNRSKMNGQGTSSVLR
jgi:hypothetical protein